MAEKLRRKGQGKKERPVCPHCQQDLKRSYVREWDPVLKKQTPLETGYECVPCKYKVWD